MFVRWFLACSLLIVVDSLAAQDVAEPKTAPPIDKQEAKEDSEKDTPSDSAGSAQEQFEKVFTEWKTTLKEIRAIQVKYQTAAEEERKKLREEFNKLLVDGRAILDRVTDAAEKAFVAAPNENKEVAEFLVSYLFERIQKDAHEDALRMAKVLLENKIKDRGVHLLAGVAAFATADFAFAKEHLQMAREAGLLEKPPEKASDFQKQLINFAGMCLETADEYAELWEEEKKIREAEAKADDLPRVKLETTQGDMVIELFENEAPIATANFISLVEKGFYDGLTFHRVLPLFMAQGGCPDGTGRGGPGYNIPCECYKKDHRKHFRGTLSMAHAGRDTGGSQFFLTFVPTPHLNGRHTAFGRVIEGMEVLSKLRRIDPQQPVPGIEPDAIKKATVVRKRDHEYQPTKVPN